MSNLHARVGRVYPVSSLCGLLGVSKQAYYKRDETAAMRRSVREEMIVDYVKEVRRIDPGIGGVKLWRMYEGETGQQIGRDTFCSVIARNGLRLRQKPFRPRTTDSRHGLPVYPNLVRSFIPSAPNQLWVSDITYIGLSLANGARAFCYLSLVTDAYSGKIVGWSIGATLGTHYTIEALRMALSGAEGGLCGLIHHSDRGSQYASREYVSLLMSNGISVSMTEGGDPKENAQAERINGTIKNELLGHRVSQCGGGQGGCGQGCGLLQQPPTAHERLHDDAGTGGTMWRRVAQDVAQLPRGGDKKAEGRGGIR